MKKMMVKKEVFEQVTSKLKDLNKARNLPKNDDKTDLKAENSKLGASKNVFSRGDFDDWKISDEELEEHEIDKSYSKREFVNGNGKRKSYWRTRIYDGIEGKQGKKQRKSCETLITKDVEKLRNFIISYRNKMSKVEKHNIDKIIKNGNWSKIKTPLGNIVKIDSQKWHDMEKDPLEWEISNASVFADRGFNVYLPKEIHNVQHYKNIDAIINGVQIEFRYIDTNNKKTLQGKYREKLEQSPHVSVYFNNKADKPTKEYINRLNGTQSENPKGLLICYFENTKEFKVYDYKMEIKKAVLSTALDRPEISPSASLILSNFYNKSSNINKSLTYSGYKLQGRTKLYGMDISIENKKGSYRSGTDKDGHKWRTFMNYDYGYIRGTEGVDGDHVDCYIGNNPDSEKVYVVHQYDPVTHKYDEDKCMLCFGTAEDAKKAYLKQYDRPGFFGSMEVLNIEQFKSYVFSHLGSRIHKSFDVVVTDITDDNKQQKVNQVEKALNAIYENKPFVIKHIPAKTDSKNYGSVTLRINNFDKSKIEKAVHSMAFSFDTKIKSAKGEAFIYKAQEQLTDRFVDELTEKTKSVYSFLIGYFGLPEIRTVSKADVTYKGKVIYNPDTGKPLTNAEWKKFVDALEKFLNRNYKGVGERIVLSSQALGRILERLSKTNSLEAVKKMQLDELKYKHRTFDWISESSKNMTNVFGETVTRDVAARIEVACHSAAQRITNVSDSMRNDIQQIIIDGVKNKQSRAKVSQNLFDKCVGLNRDFQKIADTEIQNNTNNAYVMEAVHNTEDGEKVYFKRFEVLDDNTCKKCRALKGKIALFSEVALPEEKIKDQYAEYAIWEGKEDGNAPIGCVHPYCRGAWIVDYPDL